MKGKKTQEHSRPSQESGMATLETVWAGIPELSFSPDSTDKMPTLIDKENCGKGYKVKDGEIYTVRLGMHSHPASGAGAFTKDSQAVCLIPATTSKRHLIVALFAPKEIYPAVFMDNVSLKASQPFHLELIKGSAALICNNGSSKLPLGDDAVNLDGDAILISQSALRDMTPDYLNYTYDFITFQVMVVEEKDCILLKQVRLAESESEEWQDSITAQIGDKIEFEIYYCNGSDSSQRITISEELPPCLKYVKSEAFLYTPETSEGKSIDTDTITTDGLVIDRCDPDAEIVVCYTAEVASHHLVSTGDRIWNWTKVQAGSKILENYAEVIMK